MEDLKFIYLRDSLSLEQSLSSKNKSSERSQILFEEGIKKIVSPIEMIKNSFEEEKKISIVKPKVINKPLIIKPIA